jgi:hypothetical protein
VLTFVKRAFNYEAYDIFREVADVLLGNRSVHEIINSISPNDADRDGDPLPDRVDALQRKYIAVLTSFVEARQTPKGKQQEATAYGIFSSVQPTAPRAKSRAGFPVKVTGFVEALEALLIAMDSGGDLKDRDLLNDAALFLWTKTRAFYSRFSVTADVVAAQSTLLNADERTDLNPDDLTIKLKTIAVIHRALIVSTSSVSDPLVCGQVAIKLALLWEGLGHHDRSVSVLSEGLEAVRSFRSVQGVKLDPICMVTTNVELQETHQSKSQNQTIGKNRGEISSTNDGLVVGLEVDLLSQLWSAKLRITSTLDKTAQPLKSVPPSTTRRLGASRRAKAQTFSALATTKVGQAGPEIEMGLGSKVVTLLQECKDNQVQRTILLACAAQQATIEGTATPEKIGVVLAQATRTLQAAAKAEVEAAVRCSEADAVLLNSESENDGSGSISAVAAPHIVQIDSTKVKLRVVPGNYERSAAVRSYRLFGRLANESVHGAAHVVRLQDYKLVGMNIDLQVTSSCIDFNVTGLEPNAAYIFAVAMFDDKGNVVGSIGPPTRPVVATRPLSIMSAWGLLGVAASKAGVTDVMHTCTDEMWRCYINVEDSEQQNNGSEPLCSVNRATNVASSSELQTFCRVALLSLTGKTTAADLVANRILHKPEIQSTYPQRLAYSRRLLVISEVALSIQDASIAVQAATRCYSILAPMIFYGSFNKSALQLLVICHQVIAALLALPGNQLPEVVLTHDFHHMCACLTMTIVKAFHKRGELRSATQIMDSGVGTLTALNKLEAGTNSKKKTNQNTPKKKKQGGQMVKPYGEHIVSEMTNFGQWLAGMYCDRTTQKNRVRVPNIYINLFNPRKRFVPDFSTGPAQRKEAQYYERGTRWITRAIERGQNEKAVEWAKTLIKQGSVKQPATKGARHDSASKPNSRIVSAIVRHCVPDTPDQRSGSAKDRKTSKQQEQENTEEVTMRREITAVLKQNRVEFGLVDSTQAAFEMTLKAFVTLRLTLQKYLKRKRLERDKRNIRQAYLRDGARWIAQLNLLAGIGLFRQAKKIFEEEAPQHDRPEHTPRRLAADAGKVMYFDTSPSSAQLDYEIIADSLDHLRRAAVLASRSGSWVQVHNIARIIFNVNRSLGQIEKVSKVAFSNLQLTFASAMTSVGDMMRVAKKASTTKSAASDSESMSERFNVEFARDFFLEGVRLLTNKESRFTTYVIDSGMAMLDSCGGLHFASFYFPLRKLIMNDTIWHLDDLQRIADVVDPDGSLRQEKPSGFHEALALAVLSGKPTDVGDATNACNAASDSAEAHAALGDLAFSVQDSESAEESWITSLLMILQAPVSGGLAQLGNETTPGSGFILNAKTIRSLDKLEWWGRLELIALLGKLCRYTAANNMDRKTMLCRLTGAVASRAVLTCDGDLRWAERDYAQGILDSSLSSVPLSDDRHAGTVETVVTSLSCVCTTLLATDFSLESLPVIAVYEMIGLRACRTVSVCIDARLLRLRALTNLGLYVAAFKLCVKVLLGLNLPKGIDHLERSSGVAGTALRKMEQALPTHAESDHAAYWGSPKTMDAVTVLVSLTLTPTAANIYGRSLAQRVELAHADLMSSFSQRLLVAPHPGPGTQVMDLVTPPDEPWDPDDPHAERHTHPDEIDGDGQLAEDDDQPPTERGSTIRKQSSRDQSLDTLIGAADKLAAIPDADATTGPSLSPSLIAGLGGSGADDLKAEYAAHSLTSAADAILTKYGAAARSDLRALERKSSIAENRTTAVAEATATLFRVSISKSKTASSWERHSVSAYRLDAALSLAERNDDVKLDPVDALKHMCTLVSELKAAQNDDACITKADSTAMLTRDLSCSNCTAELVTLRSICKLRQGMSIDGIADLEGLELGTGVISEQKYSEAFVVLGDEYSKQGDFSMAVVVYKRAVACLEFFVERLFCAKMSKLLSDPAWSGVFMPELRLLAKVRIGLANAANNLPDVAFALTSSRMAVKLAEVCCPDLVQVVGVGLLVNVRAERRAEDGAQATMVLKKLCTHLSSWQGAGNDFEMFKATCLAIAESHFGRKNVNGACNAILAATDAASALHSVLRWEQNQCEGQDKKLSSATGVAALVPPAVRLPVLSSTVDILKEELPFGKTEMKELQATMTLRDVLHRRAEVERLRSCAPFADDNTNMSLRELDKYLETYHPQALPHDSPDLPGLLMSVQESKVTAPLTCLHWWCDHAQATTVALYFVTQNSEDGMDQAVGRADYNLADLLELRAQYNSDIANGTLSAPVCIRNIATFLGRYKEEVAFPELSEATLLEVMRLLNPAYGGRSANPDVVLFLSKIFQTVETVRPSSVKLDRASSGESSTTMRGAQSKTSKHPPPGLMISIVTNDVE